MASPKGSKTTLPQVAFLVGLIEHSKPQPKFAKNAQGTQLGYFILQLNVGMDLHAIPCEIGS